MKLVDIAKVIRSKNAGPLQVTVDLMFADKAGFDRASQSHALCVIDSTGQIKLRLDIPHSQEGIERLIRQLRGFKDLAVAIEDVEAGANRLRVDVKCRGHLAHRAAGRSTGAGATAARIEARPGLQIGPGGRPATT